MKVFLAGENGINAIIKEQKEERWKPYVLKSFLMCNEEAEGILPYLGDFMLDSGAFTFMQRKREQINWEQYIERYADFINKNNVSKYFELDIDNVVGYEKVKAYREMLHKMTNKQSIPVWHKSRGIEEYKRHCEEFSYVSIGGYVVKELQPKDYYAFPSMIKYAHQHGAKIHCLGFTKLNDLPKYHFDSVDSTAWLAGSRFGYLYYFDGKTMKKKEAKEGQRICKPREAARNNYKEWIKFQQYAEKYL